MSVASVTDVTAGWYRDPSGHADTYRWWDGHGWTSWLSADAQAPVPGSDPAPLPSADPKASIGVTAAIGIVVGTVLLALVVVGAAVSLSTKGVPSGPAFAPPVPTAVGPEIRWEPSSHSVAIQELHAVLPDRPFACAETAQPQLPSFSSVVTCEVKVHSNYVKGADWYGIAGVGLVPDGLVKKGDVGGTADNVFNALRRQFFPKEKTSLRKRRAQPSELGPAGTSMLVVGDLHYAVKGLPSSYDRLLVMVFQLKSGAYAAFFADQPDDTPQATKDVLNRSANTVRVGP